jgi:hypothetical protein
MYVACMLHAITRQSLGFGEGIDVERGNIERLTCGRALPGQDSHHLRRMRYVWGNAYRRKAWRKWETVVVRDRGAEQN